MSCPFRFFFDFDKVVLYYDDGQTELTNILVSVFNSLLSNVDVRNVQAVHCRICAFQK